MAIASEEVVSVNECRVAIRQERVDKGDMSLGGDVWDSFSESEKYYKKLENTLMYSDIEKIKSIEYYRGKFGELWDKGSKLDAFVSADVPYSVGIELGMQVGYVLFQEYLEGMIKNSKKAGGKLNTGGNRRAIANKHRKILRSISKVAGGFLHWKFEANAGLVCGANSALYGLLERLLADYRRENFKERIVWDNYSGAVDKVIMSVRRGGLYKGKALNSKGGRGDISAWYIKNRESVTNVR